MTPIHRATTKALKKPRSLSLTDDEWEELAALATRLGYSTKTKEPDRSALVLAMQEAVEALRMEPVWGRAEQRILLRPAKQAAQHLLNEGEGSSTVID